MLRDAPLSHRKMCLVLCNALIAASVAVQPRYFPAHCMRRCPRAFGSSLHQVSKHRGGTALDHTACYVEHLQHRETCKDVLATDGKANTPKKAAVIMHPRPVADMALDSVTHDVLRWSGYRRIREWRAGIRAGRERAWHGPKTKLHRQRGTFPDGYTCRPRLTRAVEIYVWEPESRREIINIDAAFQPIWVCL